MGRRMRDQTAAQKETGLHHAAAETWSQGLFKKVTRGWKSFFLKDIRRNSSRYQRLKSLCFPHLPNHQGR